MNWKWLALSSTLLLSCSQDTSHPSGSAGATSQPPDAGTDSHGNEIDAASDSSPLDAFLPDSAMDVEPDTNPLDADADADADVDTPIGPARCGAEPYDWIGSDSLGDVLEKHTKAPHSVLELGLAVIKLQSDGHLKTKRFPKHNTRAELIRYQTQDRGSFIDATALVTYPSKSGSFPTLLILHGTAGFNDDCAPTRSMVSGDYGGFDDELGILMSLYASFGYVVVFPDYIGLKSLGDPTGFLHPYLVAEPTVISSIDSVRAARKLVEIAGVTAGDLVVIGGSQGGHAAAFLNRYVPHYAPEITVRGSVWDVPPTDLMEQSRAAWGTTWVNGSDNAIAFFTAADTWYDRATGGLGDLFLPPFDTEIPEHMATSCKGMKFEEPTLEAVLTPEALAAAKQPGFGGFEPWACYLRENTLSLTSIPHQDDIPSLFLLGEFDNLVNNDIERAAFLELCNQGHQLVFLECAGASHTEALVWAFDQTLDFLEERLRGDPLPAHTCQLRPPETCTSQP